MCSASRPTCPRRSLAPSRPAGAPGHCLPLATCGRPVGPKARTCSPPAAPPRCAARDRPCTPSARRTPSPRPRRGAAEVAVVARGDGRRLALLLLLHLVTVEAGVLRTGDGEEAVDAVRDARWGERVRARQHGQLARRAVVLLHGRRRGDVEDAHPGEPEGAIGQPRRGRPRGRSGGGRSGGRDCGRRGVAGRTGEQGEERHEQGARAHGFASARGSARLTFTAHFLKSSCLEMGQVASSVTLLMKTPSSNHGT